MKEWRVANAAWAAEKRKIESNGKIDLSERRASLSSLGEEPERPLAPFLVTGDLTVEGLPRLACSQRKVERLPPVTV
jgi:hypothetical protein